MAGVHDYLVAAPSVTVTIYDNDDRVGTGAPSDTADAALALLLVGEAIILATRKAATRSAYVSRDLHGRQT